MRGEQALRAGGEVATAAVTETRILQGRGGAEHGLRYAFALPGRPEPYTLSDGATARRNLWATLPTAEWDTARRAGTIAVLYDPADPWSNRPVGGGGTTLFDLWAAAVVGTAFGLWGVVGGAVGVWQYLDYRRQPPDRPQGYLLFETVSAGVR